MVRSGRLLFGNRRTEIGGRDNRRAGGVRTAKTRASGQHDGEPFEETHRHASTLVARVLASCWTSAGDKCEPYQSQNAKAAAVIFSRNFSKPIRAVRS